MWKRWCAGRSRAGQAQVQESSRSASVDEMLMEDGRTSASGEGAKWSEGIAVGERVAEDGFQIVHRSVVAGAPVRISSFNRRFIDDGAVRRLAEDELVQAKRVSDPHVLALLDVHRDKGSLLVAHAGMGDDFALLEDRVEAAGRLSEQAARGLFSQLVQAVMHCHGKGVAHWDISPRNIAVSATGELRLLNLGVGAIKLTASRGVLQHVPSQLCCRAPEIFDGASTINLLAGRRADAWACGVVLYYMLCGSLPFRDTRIRNLRERIVEADFLYFPPWTSAAAQRTVRGLLQTGARERLPLHKVQHERWMRGDASSTGNGSQGKGRLLSRITAQVRRPAPDVPTLS